MSGTTIANQDKIFQSFLKGEYCSSEEYVGYNPQPFGIQPGIYFNLSNEAYHSDPAIGNSNIKDLLVSPLKYWRNSPLNPKRKWKETKSKTIGTALHCYLMEREKFWQEYVVLPALNVDSEFYLTESVKEDFLKNFAIRKTKDAKTFEYIGSKTKLSESEFEEIKEMVEYFESLPTAGELFKDGYMEVSIFWRDEETGLMCKCRPDYLTPNYIADYKSISSIDQIKNSCGNYDYYLQQAFYLEGLNQIRNLLKKDMVSNQPPETFIACNQLISNDHSNFIFAFQEKEDLLVRLKTFNEEVNNWGRDLFRRGLEIYKQNIEKYGVNRWEDDYKKTPDEPDIQMMGFEDLGSWLQYKY